MMSEGEISLILLEYHLECIRLSTTDKRVLHNVNKCLEAHKKLSQLSLDIEQCVGTCDQEDGLIKAYNKFRKGDSVSEI